MAHTTMTTNVLERALGLGVVAGIRSMSAPAQLSRAASRGEIKGIEGTRFAALASPKVARVLTVLAVGELIADKFAGAPDRISVPGLAGRGASGALVGAALFASADRRETTGAALGLLAAVAASYPSYHLRVGLQARLGLPNWALGLAEDAVAEGTGLLALRTKVS